MLRPCGFALVPIAVMVLALAGCAKRTEPAPALPTSATPTSAAAPPAPPPAPQPAGASVFTPIIGSVLAAPIPVPATDGKVHVVDGLPEQVPGASPTGLPLDQYGGNHIVQDIGGGNYAFYAHLKTGSIKVKPGDRLTTGQIIAALGNTGNSDAPHLHFHVMSTPDPLRANGLPFVFKSFRLDAHIASLDDLGPLIDTGAAKLAAGFAARDENNVGPLVLDVMSYPSG